MLIFWLMIVGIGGLVIFDALKQRQHSEKLLKQLPKPAGAIENIFDNGYIGDITHVLGTLDEETKQKAMRYIGLLAVIIFFAIEGWGMRIACFMLSIVMVMASILYERRWGRTKAKEKDIEMMLPPLLMHMSCSAAMSVDIETILKQSLPHAKDPLLHHFEKVLEIISLGDSPRNALEQVNQEVHSPLFNDLCLVLLCYTKYGGDLALSLRTLRDRIAYQAEQAGLIKEKTGSIMMMGIIYHGIIVLLIWHGISSMREQYESILASDTGMLMMYTVVGLLSLFWVGSTLIIRMLKNL